MMVLYSPDWTNTGFSFILLTVNLFRHSTLTEQGLYIICSTKTLKYCQKGGMTDRLKTVYPHLNYVCGGIKFLSNKHTYNNETKKEVHD